MSFLSLCCSFWMQKIFHLMSILIAVGRKSKFPWSCSNHVQQQWLCCRWKINFLFAIVLCVCVCVLQQRFHAYKSWTLRSYCLFQITKQGTGKANNAGKSNQTGTPTTEVYHISKSSVAWHWHLFPGSRPQCQPPHHPQSPPSGRWDGRWPS